MGIDFSAPSSAGLGAASGPAGDYPLRAVNRRDEPYGDVSRILDIYHGNRVAASVAGTLGAGLYVVRFNPVTKRREIRYVELILGANSYRAVA
mgnify:CR=1 FL=1